jgi:hypothetical protein
VELNTLLLPLGIIPALFILYFIIGPYEGKFQERYIFLTFVAGIILGGVIYLIEGWPLFLVTSQSTTSTYVYLDRLILFPLLFSFLDQLVKLAVLNLKKFNDEGLPIYGMSFGLGFSSAFATFLFGRSLNITPENMVLVLLPFSVLLTNSITGIFIGTGIKRNLKGQQFLRATLIGLVVWFFIIVSIIYSSSDAHIATLVAPVIVFGISAFIFYHVSTKMLPYAMMSKKELRQSYKNL